MKQAKAAARWLGRWLTVFFGHGLIGAVLFYYAVFGNPYAYILMEGRFPALCSTVLAVLCAYSLTRIVLMFHDPLRERYLAARPRGLWQRLRFLLARRAFWLAAGLWLAVFFALPLNALYAGPAHLFFGGADTLQVKAQLALAAVPLLLFLMLAAGLSVIRYWEACLRREAIMYIAGEKKRKTYVKTLLPVLLAYLLGGVLAQQGLPVLFGLVPQLLGLLHSTATVMILLVVLLIFVIRYARRLWKRRVFLRKLAALCRERGWRLSRVEAPYRSVFRILEGANFTVETAERDYSCKFVRARRRQIPLVLHPEGIAEFLYIYQIRGVELWRRTKTYEFGWEAEERKILLLHPCPTRVVDPKMGQLDNGDIVGPYRIFTPTAFLNALERDCVERRG